MTSRIPHSAAIALLIALVLAAPQAIAHDSEAPPGAPHTWLPDEEWVMQHWIPFDETRLYRELGIDNRALERWLRDDHRTIAELARRRTGVGPAALARKLVAPLRAQVGPRRLRLLRHRTYRVLMQGHLAQHVLFHYFHGTGALDRTRRIFGVDRRTFQHLRMSGLTPFAIARRGGRTRRHVVLEMRRLLRRDAVLGIRKREQSPSQASYMLARRTSLLTCFLRRPVAKLDPDNPAGERNNGHGPHAPGDRNGLLPDSKRVLAVHHPGCCWKEPRLIASQLDRIWRALSGRCTACGS